MQTRTLLSIVLPLALALLFSDTALTRANPNSGPPTNLHRQFIVQQTKRKAAQGKPTRRHVGVWLSGGYERTIAEARSKPRTRSRMRWRRYRRR